MSIKIDKDIPLPVEIVRPNVKYPFGKMDVGDSFFIEAADPKRLSPAMSCYGKRHNMKFSCRKENGGYRVWRVK